MRLALSLLFIVHGIAHLPGFLVSWRLAAPPEMGYKTSVVDGAVDFGDVGIHVVGILWLIAALGFVIVGVVTFRGYPGWPTLALAMVLFSLGLSVLGWPEARIGLFLNVLLVVFLFIGGELGWLPGPA